ncbi:MAG TPA: hypothetical protein VLA77_01470 [Candidatus Saccharimonadales bacterium]|nr:hypothetical protein [Candidatus Saccharimonadales bacterium]
MADFSYDTVRRAAQEAVSNLQSSLNEVRDNVHNWRNDSRTSDVQIRIQNVERSLNELSPIVQRMETLMQQMYQQNYTQEQWRNQFDAQRFHQRVVNIEKYAMDVNRYLQEIHKQMGRLLDSSDQRVQ